MYLVHIQTAKEAQFGCLECGEMVEKQVRLPMPAPGRQWPVISRKAHNRFVLQGLLRNIV